MARPLATVLVCTYNDGKYLRACIDAVLAQTYSDFEFVLVNDASTDNVDDIVRSYADKRIRYVKREKNTGSLAGVRMYGLSFVRTKYVFLTDGDCAPDKRWLQRGMEVFAKTGAAVLEGKLIYNKPGYSPRMRDRVIRNLHGGLYLFANMAYETGIIRKYGLRTNFDGMEDRDLALRVRKEHEIPWVPDMLVYHQQKLWTVRSYLADVHRHIPRVRLYKAYGDKEDLLWRVAQPGLLALIFLPVLLILPILQGRVRTWSDLGLLPVAYVKAFYLRAIIWRTSIQEGVFII